jgi:hypothetical protein
MTSSKTYSNWADDADAADISNGQCSNPDLVYRGDQGAVTFQKNGGGFTIAGARSQYMSVNLPDLPPPLTRSNMMAWHEEISWDSLAHRKSFYQVNQVKKITELCGDFFYKVCFNPHCDRIHTRDLAKMRYYFNNPKMKQMHCKQNAACKHYMCAFIHTPDVYLMTVNGIPMITKTHAQLADVMDKWDVDRHEEYLKYK